MPRKQKIGGEEKVQLVQEILKGNISRAEAMRKAGVAKSTVRDWCRKYEAEGAAKESNL